MSPDPSTRASTPEATGSTSDGSKTPPPPVLGKKKKMRQRTSRAPATNPSVEWLEGYERRQLEVEEKRLKTMDKHHDEKLHILERFVAVMEKAQKESESKTE